MMGRRREAQDLRRHVNALRNRHPLDHQKLTDALLALAEDHIQHNEQDDALTTLNEYLQVQMEHKHKHSIALAYRKLAETCNLFKQHSEAVEYARTFLQVAKTIAAAEQRLSEVQRAEHVLGTMLHDEAIASEAQSEKQTLLKEALLHLECAYKLANELGERHNLNEALTTDERRRLQAEVQQRKANALLNISAIKYNLNLHQEADDAARRCHQLAKQLHDAAFEHVVAARICERYLATMPQDKRFVAVLERHYANVRERHRQKPSDRAIRQDFCDTLLLMTRMCIANCRFHHARKYARRLYTIDKSSQARELREYAIRLRKMQKILERSDDPRIKAAICEKMADALAEEESVDTHPLTAAGLYEEALNYAQMDEKYLTMHQLPLLASVATTLEEGGWYLSALPHYESLALLCKQQAKYRQSAETYIMMTECQEKANKSWRDIDETFAKAYQMSLAAASDELKRYVLRRHLQFLSAVRDHQVKVDNGEDAFDMKIDADLIEHIESVSRNLRDVGGDVSDDEEYENAPFDTGFDDALLLSIDGDAIDAVSESEDELDDLSEIKLHDTQYDGETRLHVVARCQQLREARFVLQREPQTLNAHDRCGWTPLHEAVNCGDEEMCRLLLDAGADVNAIARGCEADSDEKENLTPLMDAAANGLVDIIKLLLERGARVDIQDYYGWYASDHLADFLDRSETSSDLSPDDRQYIADVIKQMNQHLYDEYRVPIDRQRPPRRMFARNRTRQRASRARVTGVDVYQNAISSLGARSKKCDDDETVVVEEEKECAEEEERILQKISNQRTPRIEDSEVERHQISINSFVDRARRRNNDELEDIFVEEEEHVPLVRTKRRTSGEAPSKRARCEETTNTPSPLVFGQPQMDYSPSSGAKSTHSAGEPRTSGGAIQRSGAIHTSTPQTLLSHALTGMVTYIDQARNVERRLRFPASRFETVAQFRERCADELAKKLERRPKLELRDMYDCELAESALMADMFPHGEFNIVAHSIGEGEELAARFIRLCNEQRTKAYTNVVEEMRAGELTRKLDISGVSLTPPAVNVLLATLTAKYDITELNLSKQVLSAEQIPALVKALFAQRETLTSVALCSCSLSESHLLIMNRELASRQLPHIKSLDLSDNCLQSKVNNAPLGRFMQMLPALVSLCMARCSLMMSTIGQDLLLQQLHTMRSLSKLSLEGNEALGQHLISPMAFATRNLPAANLIHRLTELNLSSTQPPTQPYIGNNFTAFIRLLRPGQNVVSRLERLSLSNCVRIYRPQDCDYLVETLLRMQSLVRVDLRRSDLRAPVVVRLLNGLSAHPNLYAFDFGANANLTISEDVRAAWLRRVGGIRQEHRSSVLLAYNAERVGEGAAWWKKVRGACVVESTDASDPSRIELRMDE